MVGLYIVAADGPGRPNGSTTDAGPDGSGVVAGRRRDRRTRPLGRQRGHLGDRRGRHGPRNLTDTPTGDEPRPVVVARRRADRVRAHGRAATHIWTVDADGADDVPLTRADLNNRPGVLARRQARRLARGGELWTMRPTHRASREERRSRRRNTAGVDWQPVPRGPTGALASRRRPHGHAEEPDKGGTGGNPPGGDDERPPALWRAAALRRRRARSPACASATSRRSRRASPRRARRTSPRAASA